MNLNNISKSHQQFANDVNDPRVLSNPQEFLGPNYETVLNFWLILDELTKGQLMTIESRYTHFYHKQYSEWDKASDEAIKASIETIGRNFAGNAARAALDVYDSSVYWTTRELIGMHLILEQNKPLTFFEMFLEVL